MDAGDVSPLRARDFGRELKFTASKSSGPGGQNVNKVSTRVELRFDIPASGLLTEQEKKIVLERLKNRIRSGGILILVSGSERTQLRNREKVVERFYLLLEKALAPVKKRKPSRPPEASREKRLEKKRIVAEKKALRKEIF